MGDQKAIETFKSMVSIATEGLKALLLVNGGAVVALLTFLSSSKTVTANQFVVPAAAFLIGLVFSVTAFCSAYATQYYLYNEQFPERGFPARSHMKYFKRTSWIVAISLIAFSVGAISSVRALSTPAPPELSKLDQSQLQCNCPRASYPAKKTE